MRRLLVSFSGGETSAYMSKLIQDRLTSAYDEVRFVFANTGQENEQTLEFVQRCDRAWGLSVVWVEGVFSPEPGVGVRAKVVDFTTASRDGRPFEEMISKYGIPNQVTPLCSKELKGNTIKSWARSIGWAKGTYDTAIGIRVDEIDRMSIRAKENRIIYPLVGRFPTTKATINMWWEQQPFRLNLKSYQGNCRWCWKKSLRKHLTIISETPEAYDFPERMEREYALAGTNPEGRPRRFFRQERSVADLRELAKSTRFAPATDDARQYEPTLMDWLDADLDICGSESCEIPIDELEGAS